MLLELIGHDLRYEVESVCDVFFPGFRKSLGFRKSPRFRKSLDFRESLSFRESETSLSVVSEYKLTENQCCTTTITFNGEKETANCETSKLDFYSKKMLVKRTFYLAASKLLDFYPPWGIITGIRPSKLVIPLLKEGKSHLEISKILKEEYYVSDKNILNTIKCAEYTVLAKNQMTDDDVSIYIAIPYCPSRCNYCSFVSMSVERELELIPTYLEDLYKELYSMAKLISDKNLKISTIYIGGGTPTILTAEQLRELISKVHTLFDLNSVKEFTIEAGRPDTITKEKLIAMKEIRTPRISINPQTLNDEVLKAIGRRHTVAQFIESMSLARSLSYNDINVDIIAGLTSDTLESFCNTVDGIYKLAPENITIHSLAIKHSSNLSIENKADYNRNTVADEMIAYADKILDKYQPYYMYKQRNTVNNLENIGYTLPHHECLYNIYMMNEMHTVIGIGASAVTKVVTKKTGKIHRVPSCKLPLEYIKNFDRITKERIDKLYEYDLK